MNLKLLQKDKYEKSLMMFYKYEFCLKRDWVLSCKLVLSYWKKMEIHVEKHEFQLQIISSSNIYSSGIIYLSKYVGSADL